MDRVLDVGAYLSITLLLLSSFSKYIHHIYLKIHAHIHGILPKPGTQTDKEISLKDLVLQVAADQGSSICGRANSLEDAGT